MISEDDPLHIIDMKNWTTLEEELKKDWPKSVIFYQWIVTRLQNEKKEPGVHPFYVCCPNGNIKDGLVSFGKINGKLAYSSIYTFDGNVDKLKSALCQSKRIEWHEKPTWGVPEDAYEWFAEILKSKGYGSIESFPTPYYLLIKKPKTKFNIECPVNAYLSFLKDEDIPIVNSVWPHNYEGSEDYLKSLRRLNYGIGLYSKDTNELLSWALKYEYGDIGVLQTKKEHARKGYAQIVVKAITQKMIDDGENVHVHIIKGNVPSEELFKGLNFETVGHFRWIEY